MVTGLGAGNAYTEEAELTVSAAGEYTVVYSKAGSADIIFPLSAVSQTHQKLPDEIFERRQEGDGLGMAEVTLPVAADGRYVYGALRLGRTGCGDEYHRA